MNVQIQVHGMFNVDFVSAYGWIRNPSVELCGTDDSDPCTHNVEKFLKSFEPVPFENLAICEDFMDGAKADLIKAVEAYKASPGKEVMVKGTILVNIRPVPKSSQDA